MRRYTRSRFIAFGLLPICNVLALLLHGLVLSTGVSGGAGASIPALLVLALVNALIAMVATIKRGRDLAWPAWLTVVAFWLGLSLGPAVLILIGYFAWASAKPAADAFEPPAPPASVVTWAFALMNLIWPWAVLAVLSVVL